MSQQEISTSLPPTDPTRRLFLYGSRETREGLSPFEIFLKYSDQKRTLAKFLAAELLDTNGDHPLQVLDIGTSKGTFITMLAGQLSDRLQNPMVFYLIEPDSSSFEKLSERVATLDDFTNGMIQAKPIQSTWEDFDPQQEGLPSYNAIICSHTIYHFEQSAFPSLFRKMTDLLSPNGKLFVIARTKDQIFRLNCSFFKLVTGEEFNVASIADTIPSLETIVNSDKSLTIQKHILLSTVKFPFGSNPQHTHDLVGFFLQTPWEKIDKLIQPLIVEYLLKRGTPLINGDIQIRHEDGVVIIHRKGDDALAGKISL